MPLGFTLLRTGPASGSLRSVMGGSLLRLPPPAVPPTPPPAAVPPGYEFIGGQNTPTVDDIGGGGGGTTPPPETPPEEAPPSPEPEASFSPLTWLRENPGKVLIVVALLVAASTDAYKYGKTKKKNRRRR